MDQFWDAVVEQLNAVRGRYKVQHRSGDSNATVGFATNVVLGVVANQNGEMRVHLWSLDARRQTELRHIHRETTQGRLAVPKPIGAPAIRSGTASPTLLLLEFAWNRAAGYPPEPPRVSGLIDWFVARRARF